jgi:alpha-glucosidase
MRSTLRLPVAACSALVLLLATTPAGAALRSVGKVVESRQLDEGVELKMSSGARVRVGFATPDVVRVRMSPTGRFDADTSYAIDGAPPRSKAVAAKQGGHHRTAFRERHLHRRSACAGAGDFCL